MKYIFSLYHFAWAFISNIIFGFPSRNTYVVGVTGTKGKTTTLALMSAIMEEAGEKTALLSSVTKKIGKNEQKNITGNSMPGRYAIQKFIFDAVRARCTYVFIEVTSQGVTQHRHKYIDWNAAVFTNLSPEHIESHGSYEKYRDAKVSFFRYVAASPKKKRSFFVNKNDEAAPYFKEAVKHNYGNAIFEFSGEDFLRTLSLEVDVSSDAKRKEFGEWAFADFNLENIAAAATFAEQQGVPLETIVRAIKKFKGVSGRLEVVQRKPFSVIVDYAHTPDSLRKVYSAAKRDYCETPSHRLICVLGSAGGGRDKWKRPEMGKVAAEYCTDIILTNEDPFDEDPKEIMDEVKKGIYETAFPRANLYEIVDRRKAIQKAISLAKKGDVVIGTGKGSEQWIRWEKGRKEAWDERTVFEEELNR